jgi:hypothetical protein
MLYTAESAQFNSTFSPTTISLTYAENAKFDSPFSLKTLITIRKTHSYEDNAKFHSAFSLTMLSYASRFRRNRGVIENFEYLGEFEEVFRKC